MGRSGYQSGEGSLVQLGDNFKGCLRSRVRDPTQCHEALITETLRIQVEGGPRVMVRVSNVADCNRRRSCLLARKWARLGVSAS